MAIPINVNDILQVTVEGTNERSPWAWVSHLRVTGVSSADAMFAAIVTQYSLFLTDLAALLTTQWVAECLKVSRVAPGPMGTRYSDGGSFPITGGVATDGVPNQSAAVVRLMTDEIGANNRGRAFVCGIPEAATNGGQLNNTIVPSIDASFETKFMSGIADAGNTASAVIFSRTLYGTDPPGHPANADDYTAVITSCETQFNLGVIRNRRYPRSAVAP